MIAFASAPSMHRANAQHDSADAAPDLRGTEAESAENVTKGSRRLTWAGLILLLWVLVGLFNGSREYMLALNAGSRPDWRPLAAHLYDVLLWAAFTPLMFMAARRFPLERGRWRRSLPVHLLGGSLTALVGAALNWPLLRVLHESGQPLSEFVLGSFHFNFQWYWIIVALGHAIAYYDELRQRELAASRLETQLARAQLEALKVQIQPHFLFNTLNAISELVYEDVRLAEKTILRLADLLRLSVDTAATQEVPLEQELALLDAYIAIQQTRFRDRLLVYLDIDPEVRDVLVPHFALQPLVENAIRHGFPAEGEEHRIHISAACWGESLAISIRDNGPGFSKDPSELREGVGLANIRARLQQLYGQAHRFSTGNVCAGGAEVRMLIPIRRATNEASDQPLTQSSCEREDPVSRASQ